MCLFNISYCHIVCQWIPFEGWVSVHEVAGLPSPETDRRGAIHQVKVDTVQFFDWTVRSLEFNCFKSLVPSIGWLSWWFGLQSIKEEVCNLYPDLVGFVVWETDTSANLCLDLIFFHDSELLLRNHLHDSLVNTKLSLFWGLWVRGLDVHQNTAFPKRGYFRVLVHQLLVGTWSKADWASVDVFPHQGASSVWVGIDDVLQRHVYWANAFAAQVVLIHNL